MKDFPVSENKGTGKSLSIARFHLVATSLSPLCNLCVPLGNLWVVFSKRMRQNRDTDIFGKVAFNVVYPCPNLVIIEQEAGLAPNG